MRDDDEFDTDDEGRPACRWECCGERFYAKRRRPLPRFCGQACGARGKPHDGVSVPMIPLTEALSRQARRVQQDSAPASEPRVAAIKLPPAENLARSAARKRKQASPPPVDPTRRERMDGFMREVAGRGIRQQIAEDEL